MVSCSEGDQASARIVRMCKTNKPNVRIYNDDKLNF